MIDPHTAVAAAVCNRYKKEHKDANKTVIVSTASPYKFMGSVMTAVDGKYAGKEELLLADELEKISGVETPAAVREIRQADILHKTECSVDRMEETVKQLLGLDE